MIIISPVAFKPLAPQLIREKAVSLNGLMQTSEYSRDVPRAPQAYGWGKKTTVNVDNIYISPI